MRPARSTRPDTAFRQGSGPPPHRHAARTAGAAAVYSNDEILERRTASRPDTALHAPTTRPDISPADRLGVTFFFAILAHLIVMLGVTFTQEDRPERHATTLDVVLVPPDAEAVPERPDHMARANRDGGGDGAERVRPEAPPPAPAASIEPSMATMPAGDETAASGASAASIEPSMAAMPAEDETAASGTSAVESRPASRPARPAVAPAPAPTTATVAEDGPAAPPLPARDTGAAPPASRSTALAALGAELERKLREYPRRPRRKWISARTREHRFAAYMDAWRRKVERVGNLNYPEEAVRRGLSGSLLLEVALNPDGTVRDIVLRRSSGRRVLDAAAVRTVRLAAPFAKFPEDFAGEVDVLHVERTWIFHSGNRLTTP